MAGKILEGRTALVTGAAGGIGRAAALSLAEAGAKVIATDLDEGGAQETVRMLSDKGGEGMALQHDVTDPQAWARVYTAAESAYAKLHILVANAGMLAGQDTETISFETYKTMLAINLDGVFLATKTMLPLLKTGAQELQHGASIINISSGAGIIGLPMDPAYSMTKGGVRLFTKGTALEFAQKGYKIRVNSVHPGVVQTKMGDELISTAQTAMGLSDNEAQVAIAMAHPLGRIGQPADIAAGILHLASDASAFMTGSELVIDGGVTAQ